MEPCARNAPPRSWPSLSSAPRARTGYANGFKPKALSTRLGPITFAIPQVRGDLDFYPSALEKGVRSEQAPQTRSRTYCGLLLKALRDPMPSDAPAELFPTHSQLVDPSREK